MKILQIHKYFSRQRGGGSVSAFFETKELLEKRGHTVSVFSMHDENNEESPYTKYFARHFDIRTAPLYKKILLAPRTIYSREAAHQLEKLIKDDRPDVAHVHNIYHYLTPSVLHILKKHNIPTVFKLSDYYILSPNYKLFAHGAIDHSIRGGKYYRLFLNRSINNSYAESFVGMCEGYVHKWLKSFETIDCFLAPSEFMKNVCVSYGIAEKRIVLLRNVLNFEAYTPRLHKKKFFLYMGRLGEEKGVSSLLDAIALLKKESALNDFTCVIAGDGPQAKALKQYAHDKKVSDVVVFEGHCAKKSTRWTQLMQQAAFCVLPSVWYDNSPIAISESMAHATPVIVSDCGGTKEMIEDGISGLVFEHGNVNDLAIKMKMLIQNRTQSEKMGRSAVERVKIINNEDAYYCTLLSIYKKAMRAKKLT